MIHFFDRYFFNPHWRTIKIYGQAKVLGISATTLIIAPLLSRILIKLNEMETTIRHTHPVLDALFPLIKYYFELPLSIKLLVGSALFAAFGKLLYEATCPSYIKAGDTYEQFRHTQARATDLLTDGFMNIMQGPDREKKGKIVSGLQALKVGIAHPQFPDTEHWGPNTGISIHVGGRPSLNGPPALVSRSPEFGGPLFYVLRDVMDDSRHAARVACALLYGIAFLLLLITLAMQLEWAVRGMLL